ncbi:MAG: hypothetical protein EOP04_27140 [Proteobacteria bacterium]|nr:MAG: hypothetical protein EOP04_27140 [Pseudomonadota bacterium]
MDEYGSTSVFQFLWLAYLQANFLRMPDEKSWQRMFSMAGIPSTGEKSMKALAKIAFTLDLNFRTKTTQLHLQLSGLATTLPKLLDFDFLSLAERSPTQELFADLSRQVQL